MRIVIDPHSITSSGARALRDWFKSQGVHSFLLRKNTGYVPRPNDFIINWGRSSYNRGLVYDLNGPDFVIDALYKDVSFELWNSAGVEVPDYTFVAEEAKEWLASGNTVVVRTVLNGSSGEGIILVGPDEDLPEGENFMYVKYIPKAEEYRVHVVDGVVIDTQQKRRRRDFEGEIDSKIRSHSRGWVFCRDNVREDERRDDLAIRAVLALTLDFGAVDIIYNRRRDSYYVLEVNTAPGLEGTTVERYGRALLNLVPVEEE